MTVLAATVTIVLLAARAPDVGDMSIVVFGGTVGALLSGAVALLRELPPEQLSALTTKGMLAGGGCGLFACAVALIHSFLL